MCLIPAYTRRNIADSKIRIIILTSHVASMS
jgi:hypothetical protein